MNTYVYQIGDALYINLTNRCTNDCEFCIRKKANGVEGYNLWLDREPSAKEVIKEIGDPKCYSEIVFCGYGEPLIKVDEIIEIAREIKRQGGKVRINTNGQANLYHGQNIVPRLAGLVDRISISLNAPSAKRYQQLCRSVFGERAFQAVVDFAKECTRYIPEVILSVVDVISEKEIEECRKIAKNIGAKFRVRSELF